MSCRDGQELFLIDSGFFNPPPANPRFRIPFLPFISCFPSFRCQCYGTRKVLFSFSQVICGRVIERDRKEGMHNPVAICAGS